MVKHPQTHRLQMMKNEVVRSALLIENENTKEGVKYRLSFDNDEIELVMGQSPLHKAPSPGEVLRSLPSKMNGWWVKSCVNCNHFFFTAMSIDMSGGEKGYCGLGHSALDQILISKEEDMVGPQLQNTLSDLGGITNIYFVCDEFTKSAY